MLILALDTTTRGGSLALARDCRILEVFAGDSERTHATRLPGDILECLARNHLTLEDVDLYGVAAGPGSFTGLRVGIATIQGLAFANGRPVVGVSALDALAEAAGAPLPGERRTGILRAAWMDAQRGEVFGCLYREADDVWQAVGDPVVNRPLDVLAAWADAIRGASVEFVGDGAVAYANELERSLATRSRVISPVPPLAPAVATLAGRAAAAGLAVPPAGIRPLYVRRPDVELARERRGIGAS
jgi:tRNA threonylcarbamoyladenosine biosynthesis protein TsaB